MESILTARKGRPKRSRYVDGTRALVEMNIGDGDCQCLNRPRGYSILWGRMAVRSNFNGIIQISAGST